MSSDATPKPRHFGLLIFPGWELLDMAGPLECLNSLTHHGVSDLKLTTISAEKGPVSTHTSHSSAPGIAAFQQSFVAEATLTEAASLDLDVLIIPGGLGVLYHMPPTFEFADRPELRPYIEFIAKIFPRLQYLFTICNGSGLAAKAGVLDGKRATTNKTFWKATASLGPMTHWVAHARWVEDGKCWTTSGVSAGIDGMVALIAKIWGENVAEKTTRGMEYVRQKDANADPFAVLEGAEDIPPLA